MNNNPTPNTNNANILNIQIRKMLGKKRKVLLLEERLY